MEKTIHIGEKEVLISNNVAWVMEYRDQFGKDVLETMMPIITTLIETLTSIVNETGKTENIGLEDISKALEGRAFDITLPLTQLGLMDSVVNVVWAMAKAADPKIAPPREWVRQFDSFPLDEIIPEVGGMILKGFASAKNLERLTSIKTKVTKKRQPKKKS